MTTTLKTALDETRDLYYALTAKKESDVPVVYDIQFYQKKNWTVVFKIGGKPKEYSFRSHKEARNFMLSLQCMAMAKSVEQIVEGIEPELRCNGGEWHYSKIYGGTVFDLVALDIEYPYAGNEPCLSAKWRKRYGESRFFNIDELPVGTYDCAINIIRNVLLPFTDNTSFAKLSELERHWVTPVRRVISESRTNESVLCRMPMHGPQVFDDEFYKSAGEQKVSHAIRIGAHFRRGYFDANGNDQESVSDVSNWCGEVLYRHKFEGTGKEKYERVVFVDPTLEQVLEWCDNTSAYTTVDSNGNPLEKWDPVKNLDQELAILREELIPLVQDGEVDYLWEIFNTHYSDSDKDGKLKIIIGNLGNKIMAKSRDAKIKPIIAPAE